MSSKLLRDKISVGSDISLIKLDIISLAGVRIDATKIFVELEIYENIFSSVLTGSLTIQDKYNFTKNVPLIGKETIELVFKTPSSDEVRKTFSIYEIEMNQRVPGKNETILVLKFASKQYTLNHSTKISKSYSSKKLSSIVRSIFDDYLKTDKNETIVVIDDTKEETTLVIPNWNPFQAINWIAGEASYDENCDYVFYEGIGCFYFVPLSFLKTQKPVTTFEYAPAKKEEISFSDVNEQLRRIESYTEISDGYKKSELEMEGVFSSVMGVFDSTYKNLEYNFFSYISDFENTNKIHENPIGPVSYITSVSPLNKLMIRSKSKFLHDGIPEQISLKNIQKRISQVGRLHDKVIKIDIPGDSRRRVGEIVELLIPSTEFLPLKIGESVLDDLLSGKYLVTAIGHHIVRQDGYYMGIEMMKDSYINQIPDIVNVGGSVS